MNLYYIVSLGGGGGGGVMHGQASVLRYDEGNYGLCRMLLLYSRDR